MDNLPIELLNFICNEMLICETRFICKKIQIVTKKACNNCKNMIGILSKYHNYTHNRQYSNTSIESYRLKKNIYLTYENSCPDTGYIYSNYKWNIDIVEFACIICHNNNNNHKYIKSYNMNSRNYAIVIHFRQFLN